MDFFYRIKERNTRRKALDLNRKVLVVIYERRRVGKSELIKKVLPSSDTYHLSEKAQLQKQIDSFAKAVSFTLEGFNQVTYPNWKTVLLEIYRYISENIIVCLDEFSYFVKTDASLPSVVQQLINNRSLRYNLILCGSSQRMMHSLVLNYSSPLYQRCAWQPKISQLRFPYIQQALGCSTQEAVEECAVRGGVLRYWQLRADYASLEEALRKLLVNNYCILYEEPTRLLRDKRRDTAKSSSILSIIGNGANRISEIAGRIQQPATNLSQPFSVLLDLGYLERDVPFGENPKNSKKGLYKLGDNFLSFFYQFIQPNQYLIELNRQDLVIDIIHKSFSTYVEHIWEKNCHDFVSENEIDGILYGPASSWWGGIPKEGASGEYEQVEIDLVAESLDEKHLFVTECKWRKRNDARSVYDELIGKSKRLPFVSKRKTVYTALLLKSESKDRTGPVIIPKTLLKLSA